MACVAATWIRLAGFFALTGVAAAQSLPPRTLPAPRASAALTSTTISGTCVMGTTMYDLDTQSNLLLQNPAYIGEFNLAHGYQFNSRPLGVPGVIDLAWGPDFALYGVTNSVASGQDANALFRIDPVANTSTRIGSTGLQLQDGDLATDPKTGTIYGADGQRLFVFNGLTTTNASAAAQLIWQIPLPDPSWEIHGLAFDPAGSLYALAQTAGPSGPTARLLRLNISTQTVTSSITLPIRFRSYGGLEFLGTRLYFAQGYRPGSNFLLTSGEPIYEIDRTTGAVTMRDYTTFFNGLASLVSCRPQIQICRPPPPDMVAWYAMDGNANDRVLGNNAIPSAAVSFPLTKVDRGAHLYWGYLTIPAGPVLNQGLGDFSIEAWVVILPETLTAGVRTLIDKRGYVNGRLRGWSVMQYNGRFGLQLADGDYTNYFDATPLSTGIHHIAVTVDRDNPQGIIFYVDGIPRPALNPTDRQGNLDNNAPTYIGRHSFQTASERWIRVDELQFFDRVLTPQEIFSTWEAQGSGNCKV